MTIPTAAAPTGSALPTRQRHTAGPAVMTAMGMADPHVTDPVSSPSAIARTMRLTAMATVGVLLAAGCSGGSNDTPRTQTLTPSPSTATTTATATPTPTLAPEAQAALNAYLAAVRAGDDAERDPAAFVKDDASVRPFTSVTFDPLQAQYLSYALNLARSKTAFRGTPPSPRARVKSVDMSQKPYPVAIVVNCPTPAPSWERYLTTTGKVVPETRSSVPLPHEITATVIYYKKRWGVSKVTSDESRTCTAVD